MSRQRHYPLPVELIERIGDHLFGVKPPILDHTGNASVIHSKPLWIDIEGFMSASVHLHNIGFARWLCVITVMDTDDWAIILPHAPLVREIQCLDRALCGAANQYALAQLPNLYAARIDAHSDVSRGKGNGFAYQDVIVALPPSLRRLEVVNAHGPDIKVIATVKECCPKIEELRLGRCTMFNRMPACNFWRAFPHSHNAYISATGTESYAHSLGGELSPLNNLRSLRMGLYLTSSDVVIAHRLYHRHDRVAPEFIDWRAITAPFESDSNAGPGNIEPATTDQLIAMLHQLDSEPGASFDCRLCIEMTAAISQRAEMAANRILRGYVPSLARIEWMGWLTPGHLGVNSFDLSQDFGA